MKNVLLIAIFILLGVSIITRADQKPQIQRVIQVPATPLKTKVIWIETGADYRREIQNKIQPYLDAQFVIKNVSTAHTYGVYVTLEKY